MIERLPADVLWSHVLPKCGIDVRLALGLEPRKLDMGPYESGALGDAFRRRSKAMMHVEERFHDIELWAHDGSSTTYVDHVVEDQGEVELRRRVARVVMPVTGSDPDWYRYRFLFE
jgi:hypothetical protein